MELAKYSEIQKIAKEVLRELPRYITPKSTEQSIAKAAQVLLAEKGVMDTWYYLVPAFVLLGSRSCLSISGKDYTPSFAELVGEDNLITVDLSPSKEGVWGDCARSFIVEGGKVIENPKKGEFSEGIEMECYLHKKMKQFVTPEITFSQLYEYGNTLISKKGWENLDFNGNLGHSIERERDERLYIESGCAVKVGTARLFTFEPHVRRQGGEWGFKHENIYYFDSCGRINEL